MPALPQDPTGGLRRRVAVQPQQLHSDPPLASPPLRVGLLGGSFNPAHEGHRFLSVAALQHLGLDRVWWLVTPQNPLKARHSMLPLAERVAAARTVARHPRITVTALEARLGTRYTIDTVARLQRWGGHRFVFLLGADNLAQLPRWRRWTDLVVSIPLAVIERHPHAYAALAGPAAVRLRAARVPAGHEQELVDRAAPAWTFLRLRPHPASSTAIRAAGGALSPAPRARERKPSPA